MSHENIERFYRTLELDEVLCAEAKGLAQIYEDQEDLIRAFIELGTKAGFPFTVEEYIAYLYRKAEDVSPNQNRKE